MRSCLATKHYNFRPWEGCAKWDHDERGSPASKGVAFPWLLAHVSHESKGNVTTIYIHFHETSVVLVYIQLLSRLSTAVTHINNPTLSPEMLHCVLYLADSRVRQRETRPLLWDQTHTSTNVWFEIAIYSHMHMCILTEGLDTFSAF